MQVRSQDIIKTSDVQQRSNVAYYQPRVITVSPHRPPININVVRIVPYQNIPTAHVTTSSVQVNAYFTGEVGWKIFHRSFFWCLELVFNAFFVKKAHDGLIISIHLFVCPSFLHACFVQLSNRCELDLKG